MKAYGLTKKDVDDSDDVVGIQEYGRKTSIGRLPGPGGDTRSMIKGSDKKKRARRIYKKKARARFKQELINNLKK